MSWRWSCVLVALVSAAQEPSADRAMVASTAPQLLWQAPRPGTVQDWTCVFDGCDYRPAPPFHFVSEDTSGTTPKLSVRDGRGRTWNVKFGGEVIPECFASRFVRSVGYGAEVNYYVDSGTFDGMTHLQRASRVVHGGGRFARARFQLRDDKDFQFVKNSAWSWADNPFRGSHELAGLRVLMMLLSNWDAKDARDGSESNTAVFRAAGNGGPVQLFTVFDWGASLGKWGGLMRRARSDCSGFDQDTPKFVKGMRGTTVEFAFSGKRADDIRNGITVEDVRWLAPYLSKITPEQLRAGLKASGATERQTGCWAQSIEQRIGQLLAVAR